MPSISVLEFSKTLNIDRSIILLDVRTTVEFNGSHIDGSINIPLDQLDSISLLKNNSFSKEKNIYLLCQRGSRAKQAANLFEKQGLNNTLVVEGGVSAWIDAGFKVINGNSKVISLERQVRIAAGSLVLLGVLLGKFIHPGFYWLSAFVGAGLINAGITDWCGMGLLMARMPWNQKA